MFQLKSWVHYMYFYITCIIVVHHITITLNQIKPCTITTNPKFYIEIQIITLTYDYFSNVREKLTKFNKTKIGLFICNDHQPLLHVQNLLQILLSILLPTPLQVQTHPPFFWTRVKAH